MRSADFTAVTIFSEDIREEIGGQLSLIGVLPDTLRVPKLPGLLPKLCVYTRASFLIDHEIVGDLILALRDADGAELTQNLITAQQIENARKQAREQNSPSVTMLSHVAASPFRIAKPGRISLLASYAGSEILTGFLNVEVGDPPEE